MACSPRAKARRYKPRRSEEFPILFVPCPNCDLVWDHFKTKKHSFPNLPKQCNYTCDREYTVGGLATLTREFTRTCLFDGSLTQTAVVCLPRLWGVPPLAHSASRPDVAVVYGQNVTYTCNPELLSVPSVILQE